jgi:signal transduction histidine kinase
MGVPVAALAREVAPDEVEIVAACGLPPRMARGQRVRCPEGLTAELYKADDVVVCRDLLTQPGAARSFLRDEGIRGCALLPLTTAGHTRGVLYLADTEARDFSPDELAAARTVAAMMAAAVENARWGAELAHASAAVEHAAQVDKAAMLGQMAAGLARELNNVFATILGKSRLLVARAQDEALRDGLALLEEAAWRGADLVHRLVVLAAPAGETETAVDIAALVRDVVGACPPGNEVGAGSRVGIDVVTDLKGVPSVRGREAALREALTSLATNAGDAMEAGGRLNVSVRPLEGGVQIVFEDTGEGMSESVRGHAFEPFFTTRAPRHIGLGLTVAHAVTVQHGGHIEIASAPTRGTRVTLWLPGAPEDHAPASVPAGRERMADADPSLARIAAEPSPVATSAVTAAPPSPGPNDTPPGVF